MKRKLSKREKKEQKRKEKELLRTREAEDVATKLYAEVPNTNFTRTISNPEIVMKKRRERKLEQKLKDMGEGKKFWPFGTVLGRNFSLGDNFSGIVCFWENFREFFRRKFKNLWRRIERK